MNHGRTNTKFLVLGAVNSVQVQPLYASYNQQRNNGRHSCDPASDDLEPQQITKPRNLSTHLEDSDQF
jgi:hypothetical protein